MLKSNADKCHLLISSSDVVNLSVSEYYIKNSVWEKLLGVKFDNKLIFEKYITNICRKADRIIYVLTTIAPSTALRCGSLLEKTLKKSTCAVIIRIIITFGD